jgi:succinyl-CoA synthetase alpha subunit
MGHAGAVISGTSGTAAEKIKVFKECGIKVGDTPAEVAQLVKEML